MKYDTKKQDRWYNYQQVPPPKRTPHGVTKENVREAIKKATEGHKCSWVQKGREVFCETGEVRHGMMIPAGKRLIHPQEEGFVEGAPTLTDQGPVLRKKQEA